MSTFKRTVIGVLAMLLTWGLVGTAAIIGSAPASAAIGVVNSAKSDTYINVYSSNGTLRRLQPGYSTGVRGTNWVKLCTRPGTTTRSGTQTIEGGTCITLGRYDFKEYNTQWN